MKIRTHQLPDHLTRGLQAHYCLFGEEPLLIEEACTQIKQTAYQHGAQEIVRINIETDSDWQKLQAQQQSQSLFSEKSIIECRLLKSGLGKPGSAALSAYLDAPVIDKVLIFLPGKVDVRSQKAAWFKAFDKQGVLVAAPTLKGDSMKRWMQQRIQALQLTISPDALTLLYNQTEGNALQAAQEIDKLPLLTKAQHVDLETLSGILSDSSQYTVFELVDACLQQDPTFTLKIFSRLQSEEIEPILILWALTKQCRELAQMSHWLQQGYSRQQVVAKMQVWQNRKSLIEGALSRFGLEHWQKCLEFAFQADKIIKGISPGESWDAIQHLLYAMSGLLTHPMGATNR